MQNAKAQRVNPSATNNNKAIIANYLATFDVAKAIAKGSHYATHAAELGMSEAQYHAAQREAYTHFAAQRRARTK